MEVTSITYNDFATLALCNQELHKIGHQGSFFKVYKQGCMEQKDVWMDKQLEEHWSQKIQIASRGLEEMAVVVTSLTSVLLTFHEDPSIQDLVV